MLQLMGNNKHLLQSSVGTLKRWITTECGMFSQTLEDGEAAGGSSWTAAQLPEASALANRTLLSCITLNTPLFHGFVRLYGFHITY